MATRRRSRRKSISGNLTDIQKRIRYLETRPAAGRLASKAVATRNLALRAVEEDVVADNAIVRRAIAAAAVGTGEIENDSITNDLIAANAVNTDSIAAGAVTDAELAVDSVTTDKIATDAVTNNEIASNAVNSDSIAAGSVGTDELASGAVTTDKITNLAVTDAKIDGISGSKIIGGIDGALIVSKSVTGGKLADGTITSTQLGIDSVTDVQIAAASVGYTALKKYSVLSDNIPGNAIIGRAGTHPFGGSPHLQNFTIGSDDIFSGAITTNKIEASAVTTAKINDLAVTRAKLNNSAVGTAQIGELQVTESKIAAGSVSHGKISSSDFGRIVNSGLTAASPLTKTWAGTGSATIIDISVGLGANQVAAGNHVHTGGTTVASHTHPLPGTSYAIGPSGTHAGHSGTNTGSHQHGLTLTGNTLSNTSTLKAKKEIQDHSFDTKKLLTLNLKKYKYKNQYRSLQDNLNREWMYGYIAEEVQEAGLEEILGYDSEGEVASLQYGTLVTLAIELIKEQQNDIDLLKEEIQRLKEKI